MKPLLLKIIILLIPLGLFTALIVIDLAPGGERTSVYAAGEIAPFLERPLPDDRVGELVQDEYYTLTGDPVYMAMHTPQTVFESAELEVLFRPNDVTQIELGPQVDIFSGAANLQPLYQGVIEDLDWSAVENSGVTLFQRNDIYDSLEAFLEQPPHYDQVAIYHYDLDIPYLLDDYRPLNALRQIYTSLRGYHKVVTYIDNETVILNLNLMDMNRTTGPDDFRIQIWNAAGELAWEYQADDDGNVSENQVSHEMDMGLVIETADWPVGVYHIEFIATSDLFIREIETSLRYFSFVNQLYIGDDVGYLIDGRGSSFSTNARNLVVETFHAEADDRIEFGSESIAIPNTHEKVYATLDQDGLIRGSVDIGGVKIVGDGKFAFTEDAFFDPDPHAIGPLSDLDGLGIDYVLTTYQKAVIEGNWMRNTIEFPLAGLENDEGDIRLIFSLPFVALQNSGMDLKEVELTLLRESMHWRDVPRRLLEYLPGI